MRIGPIDSAHKAAAISLVLWDPATGQIDPTWPEVNSPLRIEALSRQIEDHYVARYKDLPPHDVDEPAVEQEAETERETSEPT